MSKRNSSKKKQKNSTESIGKTVNGKLDITRSGMGFVIVPEQETDILIRPTDFNTAMHGDTVRVKIKNGYGRRMQGEIVDVIERKQTEFIGRLQMNKDFAF
ncbi:MAG: ribonuclease R, partial [Chitinophagaceae bacterium]